jgi:hypothetical protein
VSSAPSVAVITFATTSSEKPFNDYSLVTEALRKSVVNFNIDFFAYSYADLRGWIANSPFEKYPYFRRGVGGWFWKPIVILKFLESNNYDVVLYMDADCKLLKNPIEIIQAIDPDIHLAGFQMKAPIRDWTSRRVLRRMDALQVSANNMWTAGILVVRNSETSRVALQLWLNEMARPANLFDLPFEVDGKQHRHDQSILSILVAQKRIEFFDLGMGFFSDGIEATADCLENAWIATGIRTDDESFFQKSNLLTRVRNQVHYRRNRLSIFTFWLHYLFDFNLKKKR